MPDDPSRTTGAHRAVREIVAAHVEPVEPVTEVKNALLQASLAQLHVKGLHARYLELVNPAVPDEVGRTLAMSWVPVRLAFAHYRACDSLTLDGEVLQQLGAGVGDRMQETSLVSSAKKTPSLASDLWTSAGALRRMWGRHYRGGSVQVTKLGALAMELELRGFVLNQFRYFRQAQLAVVAAAFAAIGARETVVKLVQYSDARDELTLRVSWT